MDTKLSFDRDNTVRSCTAPKVSQDLGDIFYQKIFVKNQQIYQKR